VKSRAVRFVVCVTSLIANASCARQPLLFSSADTYGVNISVSSASSTPLDFALGYKNLDLSLVPVTATDKHGAYYPIRGCYTAAAGSATTVPCSPGGGSPADVRQSMRSPGSANLLFGSYIPSTADAHLEQVKAASPNLVPNSRLALPLHFVPNNPLALPVSGLNPSRPGQPSAAPSTSPEGSPSNEAEGMRDSLSVFSSFNTNASASSSAGVDVGLGKVFATGVAAQQLTEGQNYYLQYRGFALANAASCLANLAKALGPGKATSTDIAICGAASATTGH
jgi:hypothetical protein